MSPVEALQLALTKEQNSIDLYQRLSLRHKELSDLLSMLIIEEEKHKKLIEEKMRELTRY